MPAQTPARAIRPETGWRQAGHRNHVGVFRHEEHGKLHGAVLGVIAGHQFGFRLGQVKRDAVGFRVRRRQINKEGDDLAPRKIFQRGMNPQKWPLCASTISRRLKLPDRISMPTSDSPSAIS